MRNILTLFIISISLLSCTTSSKDSKQRKTGQSMKYAKGFSIKDSAGVKLVEVYNPWNNYTVLEKYIFAADFTHVSDSFEGVRIQVPIQSAVYLSSTYLGMVELLDARNTVIACSNANWIYDSVLFERFNQGLLTNLGNDLTVSAESIISLKPDAVMKYIYKGEDPIDKIVKGSGIPIVYNIEFMEQHPLGRAEWIKLLGILLGKNELADSVFNKIERNYRFYANKVADIESRPQVLHGSSYKGTWFAAGGKSFFAKYFEDAGAEYYWCKDSSTGSLPLNFEEVILHQRDADVWIGANASSRNELLTIEPRSEIFSSFQSGKVYHYNKRLNPNGGLDYYESGVMRPDLVLRDFLLILHPTLFEEGEETTYWKKLE